MVVFYLGNPFVFVGGHIAKTVIYKIITGFVAVIKPCRIVSSIGHALQLVGVISVGQIIPFNGLSQFFLSVASQRGYVSVFIVVRASGILSLAGVFSITLISGCFRMAGLVHPVRVSLTLTIPFDS